MAVVAEFPDGPVKRRYLRAAQNLRLPYWDFAKPAAPGDNILPSMFIQPAVTVTAPYGRATIDNPLYQYDFNGNSAPTWSALNKQVAYLAYIRSYTLFTMAENYSPSFKPEQ
jgi:hypothetical protein